MAPAESSAGGWFAGETGGGPRHAFFFVDFAPLAACVQRVPTVDEGQYFSGCASTTLALALTRLARGLCTTLPAKDDAPSGLRAGFHVASNALPWPHKGARIPVRLSRPCRTPAVTRQLPHCRHPRPPRVQSCTCSLMLTIPLFSIECAARQQKVFRCARVPPRPNYCLQDR